MPVNKRETWLGAVDPRLSKPLFFATNSVPARAPALRFWVQHFAKSGFRLCARGRSVHWSKATAGTGLTIRSSRARFAASALAGYDLTIANAAQRPGLAQALALYETILAVDADRDTFIESGADGKQRRGYPRLGDFY